jgi:hypothetical protein
MPGIVPSNDEEQVPVRIIVPARLIVHCLAAGLCPWTALSLPPGAIAQEAANPQPAVTAPDSAPVAAAPATPSTASDAATDAAPAPVAPAQLPVELRPYEVLISVRFPHDAELDEGFQQSILETIGVRLRSRMGEMWTITVGKDAAGSGVSRSAIERTTPGELNDRWLSSPYDKVFDLALSREGSRYDVFVREWDRDSQTTGPVIGGSTMDRRLAGQVASEQVYRAFRPIATIAAVEGDLNELMARAGEFLTADPEAAPFQAGDYLTPYFRYLDRQRNVRQIQHLDWTYVRIDSIERARLEGTTISAFRLPLSGSRRRVELMAIRARPLLPETEIRLTPRKEPLNPMAGFRIDVMDRIPTQTDPVADRVRHLSSRAGTVTLPADPEHPLRYLFVHSGQSVLAQVPFIPGLASNIELNTPNDTARLKVEGALSLIEGELIDNLARRGVLMSRARKAAETDKWTEVDEYIREFNALPDLAQVEQRISAIETPAVQSARRFNDRVGEGRIKRLCREVRETAAKHLDPETARDFRDEMNSLRGVTSNRK